jgi:hypothetical protein
MKHGIHDYGFLLLTIFRERSFFISITPLPLVGILLVGWPGMSKPDSSSLCRVWTVKRPMRAKSPIFSFTVYSTALLYTLWLQ